MTKSFKTTQTMKTHKKLQFVLKSEKTQPLTKTKQKNPLQSQIKYHQVQGGGTKKISHQQKIKRKFSSSQGSSVF